MAVKPKWKVCQHCGEDFLAKDDRKNRPTKYCSRRCRDSARSGRVRLTCRHCGREFDRKAYMQDWSQERGPFCGFRCYGLWQKKNVKGTAHPSFRAQSPARGASQLKRARAEVLGRDGHRCVRCGSEYRLHVHHVKPWEPDQGDPHVVDNLVTLCASCHRRLHVPPRGPDGRFLPRDRVLD